ncbi:hypothetical protein [Lichenicoccus roseus]|uniref:Uncharacterized protein n=1 Tax=Lichenicoccus roseus TaxID=2683649 RepID=A0A5R9IZP5_9PROT|nr:hypothetical protein [Lichenicoccus roseus]TLU70752.1 hypothetical protein FE263_20535 [Lichenicoccus roseus]
MSNYRLYTLDSNDKIVSAFNHDCADDQTAIALVRAVWAGGQRAEIWRGTTRLRPFTSLDSKDLKPTKDVLPSLETSQSKEATYG